MGVTMKRPKINFMKFPEFEPLVSSCLEISPSERPSATQILDLPFL